MPGRGTPGASGRDEAEACQLLEGVKVGSMTWIFFLKAIKILRRLFRRKVMTIHVCFFKISFSATWRRALRGEKPEVRKR